MSKYDLTLSELLDAIEEFDTEWYEEHSSVYTDEHYGEYRKAKEQYISDYENEVQRAKLMNAEMNRYFGDSSAETEYGWYQQDLIDSYRRER